MLQQAFGEFENTDDDMSGLLSFDDRLAVVRLMLAVKALFSVLQYVSNQHSKPR